MFRLFVTLQILNKEMIPSKYYTFEKLLDSGPTSNVPYDQSLMQDPFEFSFS